MGWQIYFHIIMKGNGYYILQNRDLREARLFSNTFRFIDDFCTINICLEFVKNFKNIYSSEPELKKENISTTVASFLGLSIMVVNKFYHTAL